MTLDKSDLKQIRTVVREEVTEQVEKIVDERAEITEKNLRREFDVKLNNQTDILEMKMEAMENRITTNITREIHDLAEINRAVIDKFSKLENRVNKLELIGG